jgi:hypothetical protein
MLRSPSKSLRKLAQEEDIGLATAHKAVREKLQLFPYKVPAALKLKPAEVHSDFPNALYMDSRGTASLIFNLSTRLCAINFDPRQFYVREITPVPTE